MNPARSVGINPVLSDNISPNTSNVVKSFVSALFDLIYPPYCLRCYRSLNNETNKYVCQKCLKEVIPVNPSDTCLKCGMFLGPHSGQRLSCHSCQTRYFSFRRVIAFGQYEGILKDLILVYKYGRQKLLAPVFARWLTDRLNNEPEITDKINLVVPVPLTSAKLKIRGFNQTELVASILAKEFSWPVLTDNLIRTKDTPAQASLSRVERVNNLKDAFNIQRPGEFKGKNILVIDDVLTTGATADEVSRILKKAGAKQVYILVLAR